MVIINYFILVRYKNISINLILLLKSFIEGTFSKFDSLMDKVFVRNLILTRDVIKLSYNI